MQTLHKLAGVQEASDNTPAPIPSHSQSNLSAPQASRDSETRSQKRASLPINRRPSRRSLRSTRSGKSSTSRPVSQTVNAPDLPSDYPPTPRLPPEHQQQTGGILPRASAESAASDDDEAEDFAWGPSHPCFPHPNPHCSPSSPQFASTRVIRIKRDWLATGDLYPQYANLYPEILDPLVSDAEFRSLITSLNALCEKAFSPFTTRAWIDSILGAFTGYIWEDFGWTGAKSGETALERFIDGWNSERREVRVVQLRRTGFMSLDFVVPDPGIDGEQEEEGEELQEIL